MVLQKAKVVSILRHVIIIDEGFLGQMFFQVFLLSC
jgi:voltage-gated potassium channel Kch